MTVFYLWGHLTWRCVVSLHKSDYHHWNCQRMNQKQTPEENTTAVCVNRWTELKLVTVFMFKAISLENFIAITCVLMWYFRSILNTAGRIQYFKKVKKKKKNSLRVLMHSVDDSEDRCLSTEVIHPGVTLSPLPKVESFQRTGKHATQLQM